MSNYVLYGITIILLTISFFKDKTKTKMASQKAWKSFENILPEFLAAIIFVGILLAILNPELISKIIGKESGTIGTMVAAIVGSIPLIPGFVAFPVAGVFMKKGVKFTNILIPDYL